MPTTRFALWTAIALISVLLSAVLFLACMRPEYALLYATFQANVGDSSKEGSGVSSPCIGSIVTLMSRRRRDGPR